MIDYCYLSTKTAMDLMLGYEYKLKQIQMNEVLLISSDKLEGWCKYYGYDMERMLFMLGVHKGNPEWLLRALLWSKLLIGTPENMITPTLKVRTKVEAIMKRMYNQPIITDEVYDYR